MCKYLIYSAVSDKRKPHSKYFLHANKKIYAILVVDNFFRNKIMVIKVTKIFSAILVCFVILATTACSKTQTGVVNTKNALYVKNAFKITTESSETQMKGRVIKLGSTEDSTNFGPSFEFHKLRTN